MAGRRSWRSLWAPCSLPPGSQPTPAAPCPTSHPQRSEGGLAFAGDLLGHEGMLRAASFCLPDQPHLLHSCASDGTVRGWDARSGAQVEQYLAPRLDLLSCSTNGALVAAGGGDKVLFWDRRTQVGCGVVGCLRGAEGVEKASGRPAPCAAPH